MPLGCWPECLEGLNCQSLDRKGFTEEQILGWESIKTSVLVKSIRQPHGVGGWAFGSMSLELRERFWL